jgi:Rap1a immunity proteins
MRAVLLGLLAGTLLAGNADAQQSLRSANELVPACKNFLAERGTTLKDGFDQGLCVGLLDAVNYLTGNLPPDFSSCNPKGVTVGQQVRVFLAYVERRPQRLHEDFRNLAIEAFHEAWPCKGGR